MTTPENPDRRDPHPKPESSELGDSINELEHLITDKATPATDTAQAIPVLDDVVDPDAMGIADSDDDFPVAEPGPVADHPPHTRLTREQLDNLINALDEKLAGELDELVNILKDAIKDSIITEIKSRLEDHIRDEPPAGTEGGPQRDDRDR